MFIKSNIPVIYEKKYICNIVADAEGIITEVKALNGIPQVKKGDIVISKPGERISVDGEIVEVCVNDGDMVDYGKPLFKIK